MRIKNIEEKFNKIPQNFKIFEVTNLRTLFFFFEILSLKKILEINTYNNTTIKIFIRLFVESIRFWWCIVRPVFLSLAKHLIACCILFTEKRIILNWKRNLLIFFKIFANRTTVNFRKDPILRKESKFAKLTKKVCFNMLIVRTIIKIIPVRESNFFGNIEQCSFRFNAPFVWFWLFTLDVKK